MSLSHMEDQGASVKLIIFDCDGVLIDSEILSKRVLLEMLGELGTNVSGDYFDTHFLGQSYTAMKARLFADFNLELPEEFREAYLENLLSVYAKELKATDNLTDMLSKLKVKSCVATSSSPERVSFSLQTTGLSQFFNDSVFTCSQVKRGKPAPDIFLYAASQMQVDPENCLVIEDSHAGIQAALAANMQVIKYAGAGHLKSKGILKSDIANSIFTVLDWKELFKLFPSFY